MMSMQIATFAAGCFWGVEEAFRTLPGVKETVVEKSKIALEKSGKWKNPIVTEIIPAGTFYHAEEYHQQYLVKRGIGSCHI